jgi:hypothetical protein
MKTIAALFLSMFIGIYFVAAQDQPVQPAPKTINWNETTHDFGKIPVNVPAGVTFTVKNSGTAPILITQAKSSCGCTVAEYTKEPIKPGESGVVKATYNAAHAGPFTKTVTVTFDGIAVADVLVIKGEVEGPPTPAPAPATPTTPPTSPTPEKK